MSNQLVRYKPAGIVAVAQVGHQAVSAVVVSEFTIVSKDLLYLRDTLQGAVNAGMPLSQARDICAVADAYRRHMREVTETAVVQIITAQRRY